MTPRLAAVAVEMASYGSDRHHDPVLEQLLAGISAAARGDLRPSNADAP